MDASNREREYSTRLPHRTLFTLKREQRIQTRAFSAFSGRARIQRSVRCSRFSVFPLPEHAKA